MHIQGNSNISETEGTGQFFAYFGISLILEFHCILEEQIQSKYYIWEDKGQSLPAAQSSDDDFLIISQIKYFYAAQAPDLMISP